MLTIASWNVNSLRVRLSHLEKWLGRNSIDVLAIQETKCVDEVFPLSDIEALGYQAVFSGQKTYNGVAILSREPLTDIVTDIPNLDDPQRRILAATLGGGTLRIINLYVPNGSEVGSEKYAYKLDWLEKVTAFLEEELSQHENVIVLGDFNIAPEDADVHDPVAWEGHVLVSAAERDELQNILTLGFKDSFRLFDQESETYSWWDYRNGAFWRNQGMRIDHLLLSDALAEHCESSTIDKSTRRWKRPSDHAPALVELRI